jgi:DNA polymerase IV
MDRPHPPSDRNSLAQPASGTVLEPQPATRRLLLVDCDMFFVQVAKLEDPEGLGREELIIVGGRPEGRGVVASASYGARAYGVRSAMPVRHALRLCPRAVVVPVPRSACARVHRQIRQTLEVFAPIVEAASIDEFYLDLCGTERLYRGEELAATARRIQQAVLGQTGVATSVGGGAQRLIAKLAAEVAKPGGVHVVRAGDEAAFMCRFQLVDLPGVGPVFAEKLRRRGLRTVRDALVYDQTALSLWLGESRGRWLYRRLRGLDDTPVKTRAEAKSLRHERTFAEDLHSLDALQTRLLQLVLEVATELRGHGWRARTITTYVRDRDFRDRQMSRTLDEPVESDRAIGRVASALLRRLWGRRPVGVRLLGVSLSNFVFVHTPQQMRLEGITAAAEDARDRSLAAAADRLRGRFGKDAVVPARIIPRSDRREPP